MLWKMTAFAGIDQSEANERAALICQLIDEFVDDGSLIAEALSEAIRLKHSVYDMLYYVLARRNSATLLTKNAKLQKLCARTGVSCATWDYSANL